MAAPARYRCVRLELPRGSWTRRGRAHHSPVNPWRRPTGARRPGSVTRHGVYLARSAQHVNEPTGRHESARENVLVCGFW